MSKNYFEVATRTKMRFPYKGMISVEELWDLSITALDSIFKELNSRMRLTKEESLMNVKSKADELLELQIDIVKYIAAVKQEEAEAAKKNAEIKARNQKIMQLIDEKEDEKLKNLPVEELKKMLTDS